MALFRKKGPPGAFDMLRNNIIKVLSHLEGEQIDFNEIRIYLRTADEAAQLLQGEKPEKEVIKGEILRVIQIAKMNPNSLNNVLVRELITRIDDIERRLVLIQQKEQEMLKKVG